MVIAAIATLFVFGCFSQPAYALTISPARIETSGDPGTTVGGQFTLINEQATAETFYVSYENFSAQGETGTPAFSADKSDLDTWMTVTPSQMTIAPGQAVIVPYSIAIPKTAQPGGYFAAIFWSNNPPSNATSQVSIGAKVGLLILLSVNGNVTESAGINQFDRDGHGFFYTALPVTMQYRFRNNGGDRVQPSGTVNIRDTFFISAAKLDANAAQGNILPGSTRLFTVQWLKQSEPLPIYGFFNNVSYEWQNFAIGLYSAHLDLAYGAKHMHTAKTIWFMVLPWQLLACIIAAIVIVWWGGRALLTRYNRHIIRQAQLSMRNHDTDQS